MKGTEEPIPKVRLLETKVTTLDPTKTVCCLWVDGSANLNGSGAGILLATPKFKGQKWSIPSKFDFKAWNNEAKYEMLIAGVRLAQYKRANQIKTYSESHLIVN